MQFNIDLEKTDACSKDYYHEITRAQQCLRRMIPLQESKKQHVGVAGSCATHWFMLSDLTPNLQTPAWKPNDIDIFVAGPNGANDQLFSDFVNMCVTSAESGGFVVAQIMPKQHDYIQQGISVNIIDVIFIGSPTCFSFVQASASNTIDDVIETFDIDVVKVIYDIWGNSFRLDPVIKWNIEHLKAVVFPFYTEEHTPNSFEQRRQMITYSRMRKYEKRGFTFITAPQIISKGYQVVSSDTDSIINDMDMLETVDPSTYYAQLDAIQLSWTSTTNSCSSSRDTSTSSSTSGTTINYDDEDILLHW